MFIFILFSIHNIKKNVTQKLKLLMLSVFNVEWGCLKFDSEALQKRFKGWDKCVYL
jgi:hypothetical protein